MTVLYLTPPAVSSSPPSASVPPNTVRLMNGTSWDTLDSANCWDIKIEDYVSGCQNRIASSMWGKAAWVAFNLPAGVVVTLLQNQTVMSGNPYDFNSAGICVDLIGNGSLQTVDLVALGAADCLCAFIWREVDFNAGIFQLFNGKGCAGNRNTFFLNEWSYDEINSLSGWYICDKAASAYFGGLTAQSFTLYDGGKGEGLSLTYAGWLNCKQADFDGFYDAEGSWSWKLLTPVFATVDPFTITVPVSGNADYNIVNTIIGRNEGNSTITDTVTVTSENEQSLTLAVTNSTTIGYVESFTFTVDAGAGDVELACSFSQTYTYTGEKKTTVTETMTLSVAQTLEIPEDCSYESTVTIQMAPIPQTRFSTPGYFYYDEPVPGSSLDPTMSQQLNKSTYLLNMPVTGSLGGGVVFRTNSNTKTIPLA